MKTFSKVRSLALAAISLSLSLSLAPGAFAQSAPTISVPEFKNESSWWWWRDGTSRELADALSNELSSTGNFTVVERQKLDSVLDEQALNQEGYVRAGTGAQSGELTGAQYVVLGKVTSYEEDVSTEGSGERRGINLGIFRVGGSKKTETRKSYVAIDLRVVNTTTGEVAFSRTIEGRATAQSESSSRDTQIFIFSSGSDEEKSEKAPVGKALRAALVEASDYLSCAMVEKGGCLTEFEAKEEKRRENTRSVLDLD